MKTFYFTFGCRQPHANHYVRIEGGVTGYESMNAEFIKRPEGCGWYACVRTKGRWDTLFISKEEMDKVRQWYSQLSPTYLQSLVSQE